MSYNTLCCQIHYLPAAEDCSGFKVLIEDGSDHIIGTHLLRPHAEEVINLFAFAIATNARAADLQDAIFAYPTLAFDLRYMLTAESVCQRQAFGTSSLGSSSRTPSSVRMPLK